MFPRVSYHMFSKNALTFIRSLASESVSLIFLSKNICVINNNCLVSSCIRFHLARTTEWRLGLPPSFHLLLALVCVFGFGVYTLVTSNIYSLRNTLIFNSHNLC